LGHYPEVSKTFYDFRKTISLNEENLVSFYPYQNYVVSYLYNISFRLKEKDSTKNDITVNILNAINEHIKAPAFKNLLLKRIVVGDFLKSESTCRINEEALSIFLANCTNKDYLEKVNNLVKDCNYISQEEPLHNFEIISYNDIPITINEIIKNKNAVIYFWSLDYMSSEYLAKRIKFLEEKYPNLLFVGINMQDTVQDLKEESNLKLLNIDNQYKLSKDSYAHNYLNSKLPRTILVDEAGIVKNGFTNLDSRNLDSELNKLK
jgi:thiol-disulfide isomerase/thioredoxin